MIAEVIQGFYDFDGKRISRPSKKRHPSFEGRPMGSFLKQPLKVVCRDMDEIRAFLRTCRYISDQDQFGVRDHWMSPHQFEQTRQGDCDDFALWTCRQLLELGYSARFVVGSAGRYGDGHAWVSFRAQNRIFILEPLLARRKTFPRLDTLRYRPLVSVEATGSEIKFFEHPKRVTEPPLRIVVPLVPDWLQFRLRFWVWTIPRLLVYPYSAAKTALQESSASARSTAPLKAGDLTVAWRSLGNDTIDPTFRKNVRSRSLSLTHARNPERQPLTLPLADLPSPPDFELHHVPMMQRLPPLWMRARKRRFILLTTEAVERTLPGAISMIVKGTKSHFKTLIGK